MASLFCNVAKSVVLGAAIGCGVRFYRIAEMAFDANHRDGVKTGIKVGWREVTKHGDTWVLRMRDCDGYVAYRPRYFYWKGHSLGGIIFTRCMHDDCCRDANDSRVSLEKAVNEHLAKS